MSDFTYLQIQINTNRTINTYKFRRSAAREAPNISSCIIFTLVTSRSVSLINANITFFVIASNITILF